MERRFLVIDSIQLILVEPDTKRLGWGVVRFAGFLQVNLFLFGWVASEKMLMYNVGQCQV
jgi:hypothetical protein